MNAFEMNKIIGAILGTLLLVMGVGFLAEVIYAPIEGRGVGYALEDADDNSGHAEVEVVEEVVPLETLLASASAIDGARVARKCQACHGFAEGDANKVGPALYGIVGSAIAANADFSYSDGLVQMNTAGDTWTYAALNDFLVSPKTFAPGTKMSFAGLSKDQDRVDMLAYLQTLSSSPVAFPTLEMATTEMEEVANTEEADDHGSDAAHGAEAVVPAMEDATSSEEEMAPAAEEAAPVEEEMAPAAEEEMAPATEEAASVEVEMAPTSEAEPAAEASTEAATVAEEPSVIAMLATGDVDKGARVARKCQACHGFEADDGNKVGPPLYDIVGRTMGTFDGFKFSDSLIAMGAEGGVWSYENLNTFLIKPRDFVDRTKMSFSGLRKDEDRINLMAYLQSLSANPVAFPE